MEEFRLEHSEFIALNNLLKVMRFCGSGGTANLAITSGAVTVDGNVELRKRAKIRRGQVVQFGGKAVIVR